MEASERQLAKRIKHVVGLSKEIPWYAKKYKELGIDPDKIRRPQDLLKAHEKGLYTNPEDLSGLVYYEDENTREFLTSGTTGKPKKVCLNPGDGKWLVPQWSKGFSSSFLKEDRILNCLPRSPAISGYMVNTALSTEGYSFEHAAAQDIGGAANKFMEFYEAVKPTAMISLTTFAYRLPFRLNEIGITVHTLGIRSIAFGGEPCTLERRKKIGEEFSCDVFDWYPSSENGLMAYEMKPFTGEYKINLPESLMFLVEKKDEVSEKEVGDVVVTNLYHSETLRPHMVLLNYRIGDWATCLEKENGIVTSIGEIRREAAYLGGAKLDPTEVEKCIEECHDELNGEYFVINYSDQGRRAIAEIRLESKGSLSSEAKKRIVEKVRKRIYSINIPVKTMVEVTNDARLLIEIVNSGELYKGYEQYISPGKPRRLLAI